MVGSFGEERICRRVRQRDRNYRLHVCAGVCLRACAHVSGCVCVRACARKCDMNAVVSDDYRSLYNQDLWTGPARATGATVGAQRPC